MSMTEEEKAAIAKADAEQAEKDKANAESTEDNTEEETEATQDTQIDYEAELKAERERREKAEKELADRAFKEREQKRKGKDDKQEDDTDEDKPLTARDLQSILAREREATSKELQGARVAQIAKDMAGSDAEANLIVEIHRNRTFPQGMSVQEQMEEAYIIANRKKILATNKELKRALIGKETTSRDAAGTHRDATEAQETKLSSQDAHAIKAAGMVWDGAKRAYKKPLGNGKSFLYFDPKTKKRWKGV
jgi:hypothetical protein